MADFVGTKAKPVKRKRSNSDFSSHSAPAALDMHEKDKKRKVCSESVKLFKDSATGISSTVSSSSNYWSHTSHGSESSRSSSLVLNKNDPDWLNEQKRKWHIHGPVPVNSLNNDEVSAKKSFDL